eukprot:6819527-Alexandrium_andersonii.AAC.1
MAADGHQFAVFNVQTRDRATSTGRSHFTHHVTCLVPAVPHVRQGRQRTPDIVCECCTACAVF